MACKIYPDPRQAVKPDDSVYESRVDWEPRGEPYARMVLRMHQENQRTINTYERHGWFDPICPWFDIQLTGSADYAFCIHKDNPHKDLSWSCCCKHCPTGWLE